MKYIAINISIIFVLIATNFYSRVDNFSEVWNIEFCRRKYFSPWISSQIFWQFRGSIQSLGCEPVFLRKIFRKIKWSREIKKKVFTVLEIYIHLLLDLCPEHCRVLIFDNDFSLIVWRAFCSVWFGVNFRSHLQDLSPLFLWCLESVRFFKLLF